MTNLDNNLKSRDKDILVYISLSCMFFLGVLLVRTIGNKMFSTDISKEEPKLKISEVLNFSKKFNCEEFNDKYLNCVEAQNAGKGCIWYAGCNMCLKGGAYNDALYKQLCDKKNSGK